MDAKKMKSFLSQGMDPQVLATLQITQAISEIRIDIKSIIHTLEEMNQEFRATFDKHVKNLTKETTARVKRIMEEYAQMDEFDNTEQKMKDLIEKINSQRSTTDDIDISNNIFDRLLEKIKDDKSN